MRISHLFRHNHHGPYSIYHCDTNTALVQQDLDLIWAALQPVLLDTHLGTASPAYRAFFKDSIYNTLVDEIISNVTTGAPLLKKNSPSPNSPLIVCIPGPGILTGDGDVDGSLKDLYDSCKTGAAAFYRPQTNWIFLCPLFFQVVQQATRPSAFCPAIIVHFYLDSSPGPATSSTDEVYDINSAFGLAAAAAINNAQSYVWYSAFINALCRNFPTPTNDDPGSCRGRCLSEYGATNNDNILTNASVIINGQTG
ncbi:hypothetical protein JMJ35_006886 [Cladonia borealis]|uniref:Lysine-specific metallo-endopeptidase domain-containing protein n=1 Tax=Cladonia borealis TaxID=184061 RepID=A0AA39QYS8_9LECA|nr:hypothetical protein JMJ35_006886 [Cladonia borealis]